MSLSQLYNFNQAQSNMRKARKTARLKQQPKETETIINELKDLRSESSINRCTLRSMDIFYQATIEIGSESICVFYHRQSKEILSSRFTTVEELHIDCSLKCSQNNLNSPIFLLTVHAVVKNNVSAISFKLYSSRNNSIFLLLELSNNIWTFELEGTLQCNFLLHSRSVSNLCSKLLHCHE